MADRRLACARASTRRAEIGYSIVELVIVVAIIAIMIGISLWTLAPRKRAYAPDDTANFIFDSLNLGRQHAVSQRQSTRIEIDGTARTVALYDEGPTASTADDSLIRSEKLLGPADIQIKVPTSNAPGALPAPYNGAGLTVGVTTGVTWKARFLSNGAMVDVTNNVPFTQAFLIWPPNGANPTATGPQDSNMARAITIFGPSASMQLLRYDTTRGWVKR